MVDATEEGVLLVGEVPTVLAIGLGQGDAGGEDQEASRGIEHWGDERESGRRGETGREREREERERERGEREREREREREKERERERERETGGMCPTEAIWVTSLKQTK